MPTTDSEAYDTITNHLIARWALADWTALPEVPELRFTGVEVGSIPKTSFARFYMQRVFERQATFRNGDAGSQRYTSGGFIHVQCFAPRADERAAEYLRILGTTAKLAFRGQSLDGCIWFRDVRINDLDPESNFIRATMLAQYEFDEIG